MTLMALGKMTGYSWQHIGAIERGDVAPSEELVTACDLALGAGGRLVAAFPAVVREQVSLRHRRQAARREGVTSAGLDADWSRLAAAARRPSAVSAVLVEELEEITDRQRRLYHELSSAEMLISVEAHLSLLVSLLRGTQNTALRHRIASGAVEATGFAAWLWFDLGDQFKMNTLYETSDSLLEEAGNPGLSSYVTGYRVLVADASGLADEAIHHADVARSQAPLSCSKLTLSWLSAISANAVALTCDHRRALDLLGRACDYFEAGKGKEEWMYDFDHSALAVYRGQCHLRLGQPREAIAAFQAGLAELPQACDGRAALLAIGLAEAYLRRHDPDGATHYANHALAIFAARGSTAGLMRVLNFRNLLAEAGRERDAEDLDQRARHHLAPRT